MVHSSSSFSLEEEEGKVTFSAALVAFSLLRRESSDDAPPTSSVFVRMSCPAAFAPFPFPPPPSPPENSLVSTRSSFLARLALGLVASGEPGGEMGREGGGVKVRG
jgi:hypothetical protein